ncbi:putative permease [Actinobacteria bacterium IMCC26207]|nr:putative permease [Actinobacteria bacterium IMCC26207]
MLSQIGGPDWWVYLLTFLVGVGAGVLSALLGVGGAVVTTPAIRVLGATPILAVGSTVPAILPAAISGTWRYAKAGLVDWRAALGLGISGAVFAVGGALTSSLIDGRILMLLTAFLMFWSGISVVRGGRSSADPSPDPSAASDPSPDPEDSLAPALVPKHSLPVIGSLGAASGFVAGLLGLGGGIIMVPVLTGPLKIPMKSAVASSLVAVAIFSIPALITHIILGHVDWGFALPLMLGVIPGAQIGARITIGSSDRLIRLLFGALIIVLALVYGISEALAFF